MPTQEHNDAARQYLTPSLAAPKAQAYRNGDDDALTDLVAGVRWLIYAPFLPDCCGQLLAERPDLAEPLRLIAVDHEDWPGIAWLAIYEAIAGRGKGKGARGPNSKLADDPYRHVIAELHRAWREAQIDIGDRIDPHIRAPHDTNSKRRKRGDAPHSDLRRNRRHETDRWINGEASRLSHDPDKPARSRTGYKYGEEFDESRFAVDDPEWLDLADETEQEICDLLRDGCTLREIADRLGMTLHEVRKVKAAIRERNT